MDIHVPFTKDLMLQDSEQLKQIGSRNTGEPLVQPAFSSEVDPLSRLEAPYQNLDLNCHAEANHVMNEKM